MNDPDSSSPSPQLSSTRREKTLWKSFTDWLGGRSSETARDALEELIVVSEQGEQSLGHDERVLLSNILELRGQTIADVMVPRADIKAIDASASMSEVIALMTEDGHSRIPVYKDTLDNALGMVHAKDVMAWRGKENKFNPADIVRTVLFLPPSMQVLELLLEMRAKRCHMALVVDEFGGVDGLVTIEDLVEEIVGEIEDEFDTSEGLVLEERPDGSWDASARTPIEDLETAVGRRLFSDEEHDDIDTLGGLVFSIAGRVPVRGELIKHGSGLEFEILEADPRHIKRLRIRPHVDASSPDAGEDQDVGTWDDVEWAQDLLREAKDEGAFNEATAGGNKADKQRGKNKRETGHGGN